MATAKSIDVDLTGEKLKFKTNVSGFKNYTDDKSYCVPLGTRAQATLDDNETIRIRFIDITDEQELEILGAKLLSDQVVFAEALKDCKEMRAKEYLDYSIAKGDLNRHTYTRAGVQFGGLAVPFKYKPGAKKKLVSSVAVAPFVAYRTGWGYSLGLNFAPFVASGISTVPVHDKEKNTDHNVAAYSFAAGFRLTSTEDEKYNIGFVVGKDYANEDDIRGDEDFKKTWLSFYVAAALGN